MRKKLFAVIMSAMMMITFMPAMAFAVSDGNGIIDDTVTSVPAGYHVTNVTKWVSTPEQLADGWGEFIYDGKDHQITYAKPSTVTWTYRTLDTKEKEVVVDVDLEYRTHDHHRYVTDVDYDTETIKYLQWSDEKEYTWSATDLKKATVQYNVLAKNAKDANGNWVAASGVTWTGFKAEAPVIKNAGLYEVVAKVSLFDAKYGKTIDLVVEDAYFQIDQRPVKVVTNGTIYRDKNYDGKGFVINDSQLTIEADASTATAPAYRGLIAGDKLLVKDIVTPANAGRYFFPAANFKDATNPNYLVEWVENHGGAYLFEVQINKADNKASIASQVLTIKRGSSKPVKFSATFGTAKLTKLSGNTKISVKNGKIKVKKSCKKGTYKVKVKASVAGTENYASANRTKTLTIKVK